MFRFFSLRLECLKSVPTYRLQYMSLRSLVCKIMTVCYQCLQQNAFRKVQPAPLFQSHHHVSPPHWVCACVLRVFPCYSPPCPLRQHLSLNPKPVDYLDLLARPARSEDPRVSTHLVLEELLHTLSHLACLFFMFMLESQTQVLLLLHLSHLPSPHHDITKHARTKGHILLEDMKGQMSRYRHD